MQYQCQNAACEQNMCKTHLEKIRSKKSNNSKNQREIATCERKTTNRGNSRAGGGGSSTSKKRRSHHKYKSPKYKMIDTTFSSNLSKNETVSMHIDIRNKYGGTKLKKNHETVILSSTETKLQRLGKKNMHSVLMTGPVFLLFFAFNVLIFLWLLNYVSGCFKNLPTEQLVLAMEKNKNSPWNCKIFH